jgi:hypothetical protein
LAKEGLPVIERDGAKIVVIAGRCEGEVSAISTYFFRNWFIWTFPWKPEIHSNSSSIRRTTWPFMSANV